MADDITPETGDEGATPEGGQVEDEATGLRKALERERADRKAFEKQAKANAKAAEELERYRQASLTEQEKAVAKAREEGYAQGRTETLTASGQRLVRAEFKAEAAGKVKDLDELLEDLNLAKFMGEDGEPDSKAIKAAVARFAKAAPVETTPPFNGGPRKTAQGSDMNTLIRHAAGHR